MNLHTLNLSAGAISLAIWIYLLIGRGWFWQARRWLGPPAERASQLPPIVAVIAARNEERVIGESIGSLLSQPYEGEMRVVLVDDASSDRTVAVAEEAARRLGAEQKLIILRSEPLPSGWTGKLWAVDQGIRRARDFQPEFLLLTDADIQHVPGSVAEVANFAVSRNLDLASFMPHLSTRTFAEKLLTPAFIYYFFKLYPPAWIADPGRADAGAAGGCSLVRREALEPTGGIAAIRGQIIDDCSLARIIKQGGGRLRLGLARGTSSLRNYGTFAGFGRTISRTAFSQLNHSVIILAGATAGMAITYLLPIALLFSGQKLPIILGALAWLLMTITYAPMVKFCKLPVFWAATLPIAALFYMGATIHSAVKYWLGRGGEWKGRIQDRGELQSPAR